MHVSCGRYEYIQLCTISAPERCVCGCVSVCARGAGCHNQNVRNSARNNRFDRLRQANKTTSATAAAAGQIGKSVPNIVVDQSHWALLLFGDAQNINKREEKQEVQQQLL